MGLAWRDTAVVVISEFGRAFRENGNRDYPVLTDDRALLGGLFERLSDLSTAQVQTVFPRSRPVDLRLV
jgi:uncharacterized protein (DUF1501 family)